MCSIIATAVIDGDYWGRQAEDADGRVQGGYCQRPTTLELHDDGEAGALRYRWYAVNAVSEEREDAETSASSRRAAMRALRQSWGYRGSPWGLREVRRTRAGSVGEVCSAH